MIRKLALRAPAVALVPDGQRPVRLLAVSDEADRAFDFESNREALRPLDAILAAGDLDPDYLCFLADAFRVPLLYVLGNHDRGANWEKRHSELPGRLDGRIEEISGIAIAGLSWPGGGRGRAARDEAGAWGQAIRLALRSAARRKPLIVLSHVPPRDLGDTPQDPYHRGFSAYRWLLRRLSPIAWLHGHTALAGASGWRIEWRGTTLANVTGAVLVEITSGKEPVIRSAVVDA